MIRILLAQQLVKVRWTQADLARRTNIRPSTISDYYNEMTDRINIRHFEVICKVLNCKLSDLLVEVPDDEAKPRAARRSRKKRLKK